MLNRRLFLGSVTSAATGALIANAHAAEGHTDARISDLQVIQLREKGGRGKSRSYLEITTNAGINGISGELFQDTPQRLGELRPCLLRALAGRAPGDRSLNTEWLWNSLYPDRPLESFARGVDPLTGKNIWGTRRQRRHTPTGTVMMGISAVDNALWDLRGKLAGTPLYR